MENQEDKTHDSEKLTNELEVARRRNRLLTIAVFVLSAIFIVVSVFGVLIYKKISAARQGFEAILAAQASSGAAQAGAENVFASAAQNVFSSTGPVASSLTLFSNPAVASGARKRPPVDGEKTYKALMKYSNRPIVKEFIAELKKDPEMMRVFEKSDSDDPMKIISDPRTFKSINAIMAKYAFRPDFMKLAMEAMSDPELKPLLSGMPGAGMFRPRLEPGEVSAPARAEQEQEEEPYYDSEIKFDPSAISGGGPSQYSVQAASASVSRPSTIKRKAPPPVWQ